ncbi:hypothetical protein A2Z33_00365 [Candidatus Gottesmanbacteria bacterium RBG_16_52_11]|uniref:Uncharacterized protein n=1 Tax=Candidatus Gottesmanbacteria bacterium RBG_16_52_11 TaxID=1798374 RepID=A0A1F5YN59_9BACT|nr:MAG: hypothetical protein A2Z33_00365 [Candidatus Gottesmanbacteria bacterium RBG_16_52_11]
MDFPTLAAQLLKLIAAIVYIVAIFALLPSGIVLVNTIKGGIGKVGKLEAEDKPAKEVFQRGGRSFLVSFTIFAMIGLLVLAPLLIAGPVAIAAFVATTVNWFLTFLGIDFQLPVPEGLSPTAWLIFRFFRFI